MPLFTDYRFARAVRPCLLAFGLAVALAGCSDEGPWRLKDVSGLLPDLQLGFASTRADETVAQDFRGKLVLVYFGYTHCPDVCPTTLTKIQGALSQIDEADGEAIRVLFISVDPKRDSIARLKEYVRYFGPRFVGLRAEGEALEELAKRYRVTYERDTPEPGGDYTVSHSNGIFIFDGQGEARLLATKNDTANDLAHDLELLLERRG